MKSPGQTRRGFLRSFGAGIALTATLPSLARAAKNPFAYDVGRFTRTDPKLLQYEEVRKFPVAAERPRRLAMGPDGRIHVATASGIQIFDPASGERVRELTMAEPIRCVAVDAEGALYAASRRKVMRLDSQGAAINLLEQSGDRTWFTGLTVMAGHVFVADAGNRVVLKLGGAGKVIARIGVKEADRNVPGLVVPSPYLDVKPGADGLLRVNNPGRHRVELYTADGDLEQAWGNPGNAIDCFCGCCNPVSVLPLPDGSCITCEKGLPRVKISLADGTLKAVVAGPESFPENARAGSRRDPSDGTLGGVDAAVDREGQVCVLDLVAKNMHVFRRKASHG